jgi:mono/diheme cytochrome c family protein
MPSLAKRVLKILGWVAGILAGLIAILFLFVQLRWDAGDGRLAPSLIAPADSATLARGEEIFKYQAHCWSCHGTPGSRDRMVPSGGMPFDLSKIGPGFGTFYARNLTPDLETGIGGWTDGEVVQALREGLRKDRSPLFPIMPIDWYHGMADNDVLAVVAYLRTLPPVKNAVPRREPSFIAKALFTFGVVKPKEPVDAAVVAPPRGVTVEYGRYLSNNVADCADCHTPRDLNDGHFFLDSMFAGGSIPFGGGAEGPIFVYARNLTPDRETGIGAWTGEHFLNAVTSGMRPDGTVLAPIMPYSNYKFWAPEDLQAVYAYLKTLPAVRRTTPAIEYESSLMAAHGAGRGKLLFEARCQACHGENGSGAPATKVTLAEVAPGFTDADLAEFVKEGQLNLHMPAFGRSMNEGELADLIAFVRTWEKNAERVNP